MGRVLLGVIGRPHGVRGWVRVQSYTADPRSLADYTPLVDDTGRAWSLCWRGEGVAELRDSQGQAVTDRTAAERLTNLRLYAERNQLPAPVDANEFYLTDLVGLQAFDTSGEPLGRVVIVHDYGAGASLEIARIGAAPLLIPFTRLCVPQVDIATGQITIAPPDERLVIPEEAQES
jgi:16S rRNA processing protein RimM